MFNILKTELGNRTDNKAILQIAVKALNNTASLYGLVPTLLVFKAYLRVNLDSLLLPNIITQASAVQKAIKMLYKDCIRVNVNCIINTCNSPTSHKVLNLPLSLKIII